MHVMSRNHMHAMSPAIPTIWASCEAGWLVAGASSIGGDGGGDGGGHALSTTAMSDTRFGGTVPHKPPLPDSMRESSFGKDPFASHSSGIVPMRQRACVLFMGKGLSSQLRGG